MVADPQMDYSTTYIPENKGKLIEIIIRVVSKKSKMSVSEIKIEQYNKHNQGMYIEKNNLVCALLKEKNEKKILEGFKKLYLKIDIEKNKESFIYFDKLYFFVRGFNNRAELDEERAKIILALENCWKLIALENFIDSLSHIQTYNKQELVDFYLGPVLAMQQSIIRLYLEELEEKYLEELREKELSGEALEARKIMEGWTGE